MSDDEQVVAGVLAVRTKRNGYMIEAWMTPDLSGDITDGVLVGTIAGKIGDLDTTVMDRWFALMEETVKKIIGSHPMISAVGSGPTPQTAIDNKVSVDNKEEETEEEDHDPLAAFDQHFHT